MSLEQKITNFMYFALAKIAHEYPKDSELTPTEEAMFRYLPKLSEEKVEKFSRIYWLINDHRFLGREFKHDYQPRRED